MTCRACLGDRLVPVFHMRPMPLAGAFAETREAALSAARYPLDWHRCEDCGLVNVAPDIPGEAIFTDYSYRASDVPALVSHHRRFAQWLILRFTPRLHVEIGGNDGVLLNRLPWPVVNVDPSDVAADTGGIQEPFTSELVERMGWSGRVDLITSSNAFAHFAGIADALTGVRLALSRTGRFVVEVHDLAATLAMSQWDTVYHEHAVEWDIDSLRAAGARHGLSLQGVERLPLHGGLLRATFAPVIPHVVRTTGRAPDFGRLQVAYDGAVPPDLPSGSIAYGAAARATVYLDHVRPNVVAIIDGSPRRAGRFVPGIGLPILPPSEFGDPPAVLITAWPHAADIRATHPGYAGRWVTAW